MYVCMYVCMYIYIYNEDTFFCTQQKCRIWSNLILKQCYCKLNRFCYFLGLQKNALVRSGCFKHLGGAGCWLPDCKGEKRLDNPQFRGSNLALKMVGMIPVLASLVGKMTNWSTKPVQSIKLDAESPGTGFGGNFQEVAMENHYVEVGNHPTQLAMWPELSEGTPLF